MLFSLRTNYLNSDVSAGLYGACQLMAGRKLRQINAPMETTLLPANVSDVAGCAPTPGEILAKGDCVQSKPLPPGWLHSWR